MTKKTEPKKITEQEFLNLANEIGEYIFNKTKDSGYSLEILHHLTLIEIVIMAEQMKKSPKALMAQYVQALSYNLKDYCSESAVEQKDEKDHKITLGPNSKYDKNLN